MSRATLVALGVGLAFGWTLERAGLGSARKLAGQFQLTDLTVFKVLFTAVITAMLGVFWLTRLGFLERSAIYVPETWLLPQLAGGLLFGLGFGLAALCPGTSCVAAASGRLDGLAAVAGMLAGVMATGWMVPSLGRLYSGGHRGAWRLPEALAVADGTLVLIVVAGALVAFTAAERIEAPR